MNDAIMNDAAGPESVGGPVAVGTFAELAARVVTTRPGLGPVRLVAVDGPAGSGKTTFAGRLAAAVSATGARVAELHTDDLLEGWVDAVSFWPRLEEWVLSPLRQGRDAAYRTYDWIAGRFADGWQPMPVPDVLVLEGVTAGRAEIRPELSLLAWVSAPAEVRLTRGLQRDGEALRDQWLRWMATEAEHFARDRTAEHAHLRVAGVPGYVSHDPRTEFVAAADGLR